ncbi:hypothetical protein B0H14DRAFT_3516846 [Mycena olivaceomarginata]|nr:hypothetical protein B0H14DRAFT_3516846 [Mycena olivaceomarginata]
MKALQLDFMRQNLASLYDLRFSQYAPRLTVTLDLNASTILPCFAALCLLFLLLSSLSSPPQSATEAVEIRNYADLPDLFSENLVVYGWRITLALDTAWNLEVLRWVTGSYFSWSLPKSSSKPRPNLKRAHNTSEPKPTDDESPAAPLSFSITPNVHLDFDYLPFSCLEPSLLELRATLTPGTSATLEFTTPAPHVAFLSPHNSTLPGPRARTRTATPLQASLHRILELLTTGTAALALENVSNVSRQYADGLSAAATHLEEASATRAAFIRQWGDAGWREERLMMGWEAALFSAGAADAEHEIQIS